MAIIKYPERLPELTVSTNGKLVEVYLDGRLVCNIDEFTMSRKKGKTTFTLIIDESSERKVDSTLLQKLSQTKYVKIKNKAR